MSQQQQTPDHLQQLLDDSIPQFNSCLRKVFERTLSSVFPGVSIDNFEQIDGETNIDSQQLIHLGALGRTGETFFTSVLERFLKSMIQHALPVASSPVADQLLNRDRTAQSAIRVFIPINSKSTCNFEGYM